MTDLDTELRELLQRKASQTGAPTAGAPVAVLRRARRRQGWVGAVAVATVVAIGAGAFAAGRWLGRPDGALPADTVTRTLGDVTIEYPDGWFLGAPEDVGLEGEDVLLILSNQRPEPGPGSCTALATGDPGQVLMTVVDRPLAEPGSRGARPWPVELEQQDGSPYKDQSCPGWEFHRTSWTTEGRSFDAVAGFGGEASEADRTALLAAFASMRFEPLAGGPDRVVLASGQTGNEAWTLEVSVGTDGVPIFTVERIDTTSGSSSASGGNADPDGALVSASMERFGEGAKVVTLVFGSVTADAATVQITLAGQDAQGNPVNRGPEPATLVDLPPSFGDWHAYHFIGEGPWTGGAADAYDTEGDVIAGHQFGDVPEEPPVAEGPPVLPVEPVEHELYWAVYLWTGNIGSGRSEIDETVAWLEDRGLPAASGVTSCDQPTGDAFIGQPGDGWRVAVFFTNRIDAERFVDWYLVARGGGGGEFQILEVGTYCSGDDAGAPPIEPVEPMHGGTYWGAYLWVGNYEADGRHADAYADMIAERGFAFSEGDLACDQPTTGEPIGEEGEDWRVAVYFDDEADANLFLDWYFETYFSGADPVPVPVLEVQTYCLD